MDTSQARTLLRKITQLFEAVDQSQDSPSRIERDLLMDYTRQFYDALAPKATESNLSFQQSKQAQAQPVYSKAAATPPPPVETPPATPEPTVTIAAELVKPQVEERPKPPAPELIAIDELEPSFAPPVPSSLKVKMEQTAPSNGHAKGDLSPLLQAHEAKDLSDKLRLSPIDDLSRSMGINERFLTINELFGGDHQAFDQILRTLNGFSSFQEARTYLEQEVVSQYKWLDEKKQKKASVFIQLVQRRYI